MDEEKRRVERVAYNVTEAAAALGVSRATMYNYINRADFPAYRLGGRTYIDAAGLREWSARLAAARTGY